MYPTNYRKIASNKTIQKIIQRKNVYFKKSVKDYFLNVQMVGMLFENWDYLLSLCFRGCDTVNLG